MKEEELKIKWQKNRADIMEIRGKTVCKGGRGLVKKWQILGEKLFIQFNLQKLNELFKFI